MATRVPDRGLAWLLRNTDAKIPSRNLQSWIQFSASGKPGVGMIMRAFEDGLPAGLDKGWSLAASQSGHNDLRSLVLRPGFARAGGLGGPPPGRGDDIGTI